METLLIVVVMLFLSTAASIYFIARTWYLAASATSVLNLCLIVAIAALLELIEKIIWLIVGIILMFVAFMALHYYLKHHQPESENHDDL